MVDKQIEEMAMICCESKITCSECFEEYQKVMNIKIKKKSEHCQAYNYAEKLYNEGYRKTNEEIVNTPTIKTCYTHDNDLVVLSKEEYDNLCKGVTETKYTAMINVWQLNRIVELENRLETVSKETAREILREIHPYIYFHDDFIAKYKKLAKKFEVEVE